MSILSIASPQSANQLAQVEKILREHRKLIKTSKTMSPFSQYSLEQQYKRKSIDDQEDEQIYEDDFITTDLNELQFQIFTTETAPVSTQIQQENNIESIIKMQAQTGNLSSLDQQDQHPSMNKSIDEIEVISSTKIDSQEQDSINGSNDKENKNIIQKASYLEDKLLEDTKSEKPEEDSIEQQQRNNRLNHNEESSRNQTVSERSDKDNTSQSSQEMDLISFKQNESDQNLYNTEITSAAAEVPQQSPRPNNNPFNSSSSDNLYQREEIKSSQSSPPRLAEIASQNIYDDLRQINDEVKEREIDEVKQSQQINIDNNINLNKQNDYIAQNISQQSDFLINQCKNDSQSIKQEYQWFMDPEVLYSSTYVDLNQIQQNQNDTDIQSKGDDSENYTSINPEIRNQFEELLSQYIPRCDKTQLYQNQANILKQIVKSVQQISQLQRADLKYTILGIDDDVPEFTASRNWGNVAQYLVFLILASQNTQALYKIVQAVQDIQLYVAIREIINTVKQVIYCPDLGSYLAVISSQIDQDSKDEISAALEIKFERLVVVLCATITIPCPMYFQYLYHIMDSRLINSKDVQIKFELMRELSRYFDYLIDQNNIISFLKHKPLKKLNIDEFKALMCFLDENIEKFVDKQLYIGILKEQLYDAFKEHRDLYGNLINKHCKRIIKLLRRELDEEVE